MKIAIFGLSITSSWGNGHATLWRGLCRALVARGHRIVFFERDAPYYAEHRDLNELPGAELVIYPDWETVSGLARRHVAEADVTIVTSYCRDAIEAGELAFAANRFSVFYDLDSPVTLARFAAGETVDYIGPDGLRGFDLVLSYTGGRALSELKTQFGARRVAPLYGSVDPAEHRPIAPRPEYRADLSYLGTFAPDRQAALEALFIEPARRRHGGRFVMGGAQYPENFPWVPNIFFVRHLPPCEHPAFFCSSRLTLNVTRAAMAASGWCPSGRLFEAAACGTPLASDWFDGLDQFFTPGSEILIVRNSEDVLAALDRSDAELRAIGAAARGRALEQHTSEKRAIELERLLELSTTEAAAVLAV